MERSSQKQILEALILAAPEPISAQRLADVVPRLKPAGARDLVTELNREYEEQGRAFEIWEVAGGYQIRTRPALAGYVRQLQKERPMRLSRAALETLSVVAYKQPATRAEVEQVRGVEVGPILKGLLERDLLRVAGHREVPGRPILYGTTRRFLEVFGLNKLEDLPTLREIDELLPPADTPVALETSGEVASEAGEASSAPPEANPPPEVAPEVGADTAPPRSDLH